MSSELLIYAVVMVQTAKQPKNCCSCYLNCCCSSCVSLRLRSHRTRQQLAARQAYIHSQWVDATSLFVAQYRLTPAKWAVLSPMLEIVHRPSAAPAGDVGTHQAHTASVGALEPRADVGIELAPLL